LGTLITTAGKAHDANYVGKATQHINTTATHATQRANGASTLLQNAPTAAKPIQPTQKHVKSSWQSKTRLQITFYD
jgi:hypothetical protein